MPDGSGRLRAGLPAAGCYHGRLSGRAGRERDFQPGGGGSRCGAPHGIAAAALILILGAAPALARRLPEASAKAAAAEAAVAKLRAIPLPLRPLARAVTSTNTASRALPALEVRRQRVYEELHALGPASVQALAGALRDPDAGMRRNAAVALDVIGGGWWHFRDGGPKLDLRPALPALISALRDSDPRVRAWAAQDVSDMGPAGAAAVPRLRVMLHSANPGSRGSACMALGSLGSAAAGALADLRRALDDSSPQVRQSAREAIARIERADSLR